MSNAQHAFQDSVTADAGHHFARLHHVLGVARQIAGHPDTGSSLEQSAQVSGAYAGVSPVAQRRFDTLVAETSTWASAGLDALAAAKDRQPRAAAARLAEALEGSLTDMTRLLRL